MTDSIKSLGLWREGFSMSEDNGEYICLINEKEQYSVWFAWKEIQLACKQVAPKGSKEEVLKYVKSMDWHETKKPQTTNWSRR